jgi:5-methylcytosine-specific restriction endonuclease McrA
MPTNVKPTYSEVKQFIESQNYVLVSKIYLNSGTKLELICDRGHSCSITFSNFKNLGKRCGICYQEERKISKNKATDQEIIDCLSKKQWKYVTRQTIKENTYVWAICDQGHERRYLFASIKRGKANCQICYSLRNTGKNHPNFKPEITKEMRENRSRYDFNYRKWNHDVLERDNYTCQKCFKRGGELHAHHVLSWSEYPKERYNSDNGVTLCKTCHWNYHKEYGTGERVVRSTFYRWIKDSYLSSPFKPTWIIVDLRMWDRQF